eukprot:6193572-Pleurochrysis_carterae.AAC.3
MLRKRSCARACASVRAPACARERLPAASPWSAAVTAAAGRRVPPQVAAAWHSAACRSRSTPLGDRRFAVAAVVEPPLVEPRDWAVEAKLWVELRHEVVVGHFEALGHVRLSLRRRCDSLLP